MITLITDFGYRDTFVGMMKGVIATIAPITPVTDITHGITAHDITEAAIAIGTGYKYFPKDTIHVVVVDPGVGSPRLPILIQADGHFFIGPNNGVFTTIIKANEGKLKAWRLTNEQLRLKSPGNTFHGRDVFAPTAAWLSIGTAPEEFGPELTELTTLPFTAPRIEQSSIEGEVMHIDTFGNAITNIRVEDIETLQMYIGGKPLKVRFGDKQANIVKFYAEGSSSSLRVGAQCTVPYALINSCGLIEIFCYKGSACEAFEIHSGMPVAIAP